MERAAGGVNAGLRVLLGRLTLLALASACGAGSGEQDERALGNVRARGAVVAKVNGATIGLDQVRELAAGTGLSPQAALARLEEEQLLAEEAQRRGYGRGSATGEDEKRALVQALLADTIETLRAEGIAVDEVRARFDQVARRKGLAPESFAQHEAAVRAQLLLERRKAALARLADDLRRRTPITLSEPDVQRLLSDPTFWKGGL